MRNGDLSIALIMDNLVLEIERFGDKTSDLQMFKRSYHSLKSKFPALNEAEIFDFIQMAEVADPLFYTSHLLSQIQYDHPRDPRNR